jgi:hypothetical protein
MAAQQWTTGDIEKILVNPIYAGMGPFPKIVDDETFLKATKKLIEEKGIDWYLAHMLKALRESFEGYKR